MWLLILPVQALLGNIFMETFLWDSIGDRRGVDSQKAPTLPWGHYKGDNISLDEKDMAPININ
jgi:hypothetical protein